MTTESGEVWLSRAVELIKSAYPHKIAMNRPFLVALDGRCAAGKTTLATQLGRAFSCPVVHMDDFFLRPEQRTPDRLAMPGENIDHERFLVEVLMPLYEGRSATYAPFSCSAQSLGEPTTLPTSPIYLVEGSYSLHPKLRPFYDLCLFLSVDPDEQMRRILRRNGVEKATQFRERWIPLEEAYFDACRVQEAAICLS